MAAHIVVGHDINTLSSSIAGPQEAAFAVNVATYLTAGKPAPNVLLIESNDDPFRDFSVVVLNALAGHGINVTVTGSYTTPFAEFDAVFVAADYPSSGYLNNSELIAFVNNGGGVYLAGGVGPPGGASAEASGWSTFLGAFGLAFDTSYNSLYGPVPIVSGHPIFDGVTSLNAGNGQSLVDLGTYPGTDIVAMSGSQGLYAVVLVPEPSSGALGMISLGLAPLWCRRRWR